MAQSQSPPPAVWSGKPRKIDAEPSCVTRKALHPAGTPVGAITKDRPSLSVLMLGSAALPLPFSKRFALNVAGGGAAVWLAVAAEGFAASIGVAAKALRETTKRNNVTDGRARALGSSARGRRMRVPPVDGTWVAPTSRGRRLAARRVPGQGRVRSPASGPSERGQPQPLKGWPVSTSGPPRSASGNWVRKALPSHCCKRLVQVSGS